MPNIHYILVDQDGDANVTAFVPGREPLTAHSSHPNFDRIKEGLVADDPSVVDLFDVSNAVADYFDQLSERVAVANGRIYFDGDEVDSTVTRQVVRFLDSGVQDWQPLVAFMENIAQNPNEHSREQLYDWLRDRDFAIDNAGYFIGYKGVRSDSQGNYVSVNSGPAIVDGKAHNSGPVPNQIGSVIEIARSKVHHDPSTGCASGLHVGTYDYAKHWAQGALLKVRVNPRDVVSVPTDSGHAKLRCCRYQVLDVINAPVVDPFDSIDWNDDGDYDEYGVEVVW